MTFIMTLKLATITIMALMILACIAIYSFITFKEIKRDFIIEDLKDSKLSPHRRKELETKFDTIVLQIDNFEFELWKHKPINYIIYTFCIITALGMYILRL